MLRGFFMSKAMEASTVGGVEVGSSTGIVGYTLLGGNRNEREKCSERAVFSYKNWLKLYFTPRRRL
jgi:hypothetical protein